MNFTFQIRLRKTLGILVLAVLLSACANQQAPDPDERSVGNNSIELQILAINDFHGNLEPPPGDLGGAAYLASHLSAARASAEHSITVSAGDLVGASPLFSSLFHDEPSIEAANILGLDYHAVGNHEFDEGLVELQRLISGGSHPEDGDADGDTYSGAQFEFLAANLTVHGDAPKSMLGYGKYPIQGYAIKRIDNIPVAIIGLTLRNTLSILSVNAGRGLAFEDEAQVINRLVKKLQVKGIEAFIVVIHEGGRQESRDPNQCENFSGDILDVVHRVSPAVDLFVTGHTHSAYLCQIDGKPVTSASSYGRMYTHLQMRLDRQSGDLNFIGYDNVPVTRDVEADVRIEALLKKYTEFVQPLADKPVGTITAAFSQRSDLNGESALGQLIADAQLEISKAEGAVIAFMNPGGIRSGLNFDAQAQGTVTFGDIFSVQPFNNNLVNMTLSGTEIKALLEQQWSGGGGVSILAVSHGFGYSWDSAAKDGHKVLAESMRLHGKPIDPDTDYRITVNNFIAGGGDGFSVLKSGRDPVWQAGDVDALESYFAAYSPLSPAGIVRIQRVGGKTD